MIFQLPCAKQTGGDSVHAHAIGPGGMVFHGSVVDAGNGNYELSLWPAIAGAYQMSVLISPLEQSRWALGYRQGTALRIFDSLQCYRCTPTQRNRDASNL